MALSRWRFMTEEDPWNLSACFSATMELILSILSLLGVAIFYFTSCFIKFFGLEPPCKYVGCSHPFHFHKEGNRERLSLGLRCGEDHPRSRSDVSPCTADFHMCKDRHFSCADEVSPRKQRTQSKRLWHRGTATVHSNSRPSKNRPSLLWAGYNMSEPAAEDHDDTLKLPPSYKQVGNCQETHIEDQDYIHDCCSNSLQKRLGRSKQTRRRDLVSGQSNKKLKGDLALLSTVTNSERKNIFNADGHGMSCNEEVKNDMFPMHHLVEDTLHDFLSTEVNAASTSAIPNSELNGGLKVESGCNIVPVSAISEQDRNCHGDTIPEGFPDDVMALAVEDVNKLHAPKQENGLCEESLLECLSYASLAPIPGSREHYNNDLSVCKNNQYSVQFGSIVARASIQDGITNFDEESVEKSFPANIAKSGTGLQELGCSESRTERKVSQFGSLVFVNAAVFGKSLSDYIATNGDEMSTLEIPSAEWCERTSAATQRTGPCMRSHLENVEDERAAILGGKHEENLDELKSALQTERLLLAAIEEELENERNAAAVATDEAMAMIARLHEEKSAIQMEANQLQRMSEEKADHNELAMAVLKEILFRREAENMALEKEVELYRRKLLAGNAEEPHRLMFNEVESPTVRSHRKFSLTAGQDIEDCSPLRQQAIYRGTPQRLDQSALQESLEELTAITSEQISNKRLRGFHDNLHEVTFTECDDMNCGMDRPCEIYEHIINPNKYSQISDAEPLTPESASATSLNEYPGGVEMKSRKPLLGMGGEDQNVAHALEKNRKTSRLTESYGGQSKRGMILEFEGQEDGGCGVFVPVHDVYVVDTDSVQGTSSNKMREMQKEFDGEPKDEELWQNISGSIAEISSSLRETMKPIAKSEGTPRSPSLMIQGAGWDAENFFYPEDLHERHALPTLSIVSKETRRAEMEEIKQLKVRLEALEEDRELMRGTMESFKHRDERLNILQEILKHLHELRVVSFAGVSGVFPSDEISVSSPSKTRPLKKQRFCSGIGRAQASLRHQRNV